MNIFLFNSYFCSMITIVQDFMSRFRATLCLLLLCQFNASWSGAQETTPFIIGETHQLYSDSLRENRTLHVYLPSTYKKEDSTRYHVIYVLDGSANEDFLHISGLVQFFTMMQMIEPSIVVGIANVDRERDFTYPTNNTEDRLHYPTTGHSAPFMAFLERELLPYVEQHYKTNSQRTLIGQSLGGLLATQMLLRNFYLFQNYLVVSPSLWWDDESIFERKFEKSIYQGNGKTKVLVCVGKEMPKMVKEAKRLYKWLKNQGFKESRMKYLYLEKENHATILHNAAYQGLLYFLAPKH